MQSSTQMFALVSSSSLVIVRFQVMEGNLFEGALCCSNDGSLRCRSVERSWSRLAAHGSSEQGVTYTAPCVISLCRDGVCNSSTCSMYYFGDGHYYFLIAGSTRMVLNTACIWTGESRAVQGCRNTAGERVVTELQTRSWEILVRLLCKDRSHDLFVILLLGERSRTPQLHTVMHRVIQQLGVLNAGKSEIK